MKEIDKEHALVKDKIATLVDSAKNSIEKFVTSLLNENKFGETIQELVSEFHKSHRSKPWNNTKEQRNAYQENIKTVVPQQFEKFIEEFWQTQHVHIQEICEKHIDECKQIMARLIQLLRSLDKSMAEILPVEGTYSNLKKIFSQLDDIALTDAPSIIGSLTKVFLATTAPSVFIGGVIGYIGLAAMGPAMMLLAVPLGTVFTIKYIYGYYTDNDYDKATESMRKKMEQALESYIQSNTEHWVKNYCTAGTKIMNHVISTANAKIGEEIKARKEKVEKIIEIIGRLGKQEQALDHINHAIISLQLQVEEMKQHNPFEKKEPNQANQLISTAFLM
jgi:glutamate synthase domain-containing protein 3